MARETLPLVKGASAAIVGVRSVSRTARLALRSRLYYPAQAQFVNHANEQALSARGMLWF